jgi:hypothetical protein
MAIKSMSLTAIGTLWKPEMPPNMNANEHQPREMMAASSRSIST